MVVVQQEVQQLLGFDGVTNKVNVMTFSQPGTSLLPNSDLPGDVSWLNWSPQAGWSNGLLETAYLSTIKTWASNTPSKPTAIVYMQNEADSNNLSITSSEWESGVQFDAAQVRAALGQSAASTPYLFLNVPFSTGTDSSNQAIKVGVQDLSQDPSFNASVAANIPDVDMNWQQAPDGTYPDGGPHLGANDAYLAAQRMGYTLADSFAAYAQPGSPIATGGLKDWSGPQGVQASMASGSSSKVMLSVAPGTGDVPLASLGDTAATGEGFTLSTPSGMVAATATQEVDGTHLLVSFGIMHVTSADSLYYDYGDGRLSDNSGNGYGTAVYDTNSLPLSLPAQGLHVDDSIVSPELLARAVLPSSPMGNLQCLTDARALLMTDVGSAPDQGSMAFVSGQLASGQTLLQTANLLLSIPAEIFSHASQDNSSFMMGLFSNGLGMSVTADQVAPFTNALNSGAMTRGGALVALATSDSYLAHDHSWLSANGLA